MPSRRHDGALDARRDAVADGVRFAVWAPAGDKRRRSSLASTPAVHRWSATTRRGVVGDWSASARPGTPLSLSPERRGQLRPDPYSRSQPDGVHGPSEVVDPEAFAWHDADWPGLSVARSGHLPVHVGTATPDGTFDSLIEQLPRLKALGVNAIEPLPHGRVSGPAATGATTASTCSPRARRTAAPTALKRFVDAAHQHGLGVILDVVYNHFGPDGNYLRDFSPDYFTDRYQTPWGEAINYDGPNSEWVRELVARQRALLAARIPRRRSAPGRHPRDLRRVEAAPAGRADQTLRASLPARRQVVLIAETHENDVRYLHAGATRAASDSTRSGPTTFTTRCAATAPATTRATTPITPARSTRSRGASSRAGCTTASRRPAAISTSVAARPRDQPRQFVYVLQNHDQVGNRAFGERLHHAARRRPLSRRVGAAAVPAVHADAVHGPGVRRVVAVPVLHRPQPRARQAGDRGPAARVQGVFGFRRSGEPRADPRSAGGGDVSAARSSAWPRPRRSPGREHPAAVSVAAARCGATDRRARRSGARAHGGAGR